MYRNGFIEKNHLKINPITPVRAHYALQLSSSFHHRSYNSMDLPHDRFGHFLSTFKFWHITKKINSNSTQQRVRPPHRVPWQAGRDGKREIPECVREHCVWSTRRGWHPTITLLEQHKRYHWRPHGSNLEHSSDEELSRLELALQWVIIPYYIRMCGLQ